MAQICMRQDFRAPAFERVKAFQRYLLDHGVTATIRASRGRDILAACGQLRGAARENKLP